LAEIEIEITDRQKFLAVDLEQLQSTVRYVLTQFSLRKAVLSLVIVDDPAISELKKRFYGKSMVTDVLSFDLRDDTDSELDCEVIVNGQRALEAAKDRSIDALAELNLYVIHGLLHQLGYNDQTPRQSRRMHKKEDQLLEELGFGRVYQS